MLIPARTVLWLSVLVLLPNSAMAATDEPCYSTKYELQHDGDQHEKNNIETIMNFGRCVREREKQRVGKWFCYISEMAGIQRSSENDPYFSGAIKPKADKFFVTISEIPEGQKEMNCDWGIFGLNYSLSSAGQAYGNRCLANFKIEFSPALPPFFNGLLSANTFNFDQGGPNPAAFTLYGTGDFTMLRASGTDASYVLHGRCEKIN